MPPDLNQDCIRTLQTANLSDRVVVVGSGPSSAFIASLQSLLELLSTECGVTKTPGETFWGFAQKAHDSNRKAYFKAIRDTYSNTPLWTSDIYKHIVAGPFRAFVTLNYDDQMPKAFSERHQAQNFSVYPAPRGRGYWVVEQLLARPKSLIALHGCADSRRGWEKRIILKENDYNKHYTGRQAVLLDWWKALLMRVPCIFIGTSLQEPGLWVVMKQLRDYRDHIEKLNHILLVATKKDPLTDRYEPKDPVLGVNPLRYDPLDGQFSGLAKILSHFSGLDCDRPDPVKIAAPSKISATEPSHFTL